MKRLMGLAALTGVILFSANTLRGSGNVPAEENSAPKHSIKEVMKLAHKDGLLKKILSGEASQEEKIKLMDLYIDMLEGEPKKGEQMDWIMASGPAVIAASKVVAGREGALQELKKTTNCKACHDKFK